MQQSQKTQEVVECNLEYMVSCFSEIGRIYQSCVSLVTLYGSETWFLQENGMAV